MHERVIKRCMYKIKQLSQGKFKMIPLSEIIRSLELNPFENHTVLRISGKKRANRVLQQRNQTYSDQLDILHLMKKNRNELQQEGKEEDSILKTEETSTTKIFEDSNTFSLVVCDADQECAN